MPNTMYYESKQDQLDTTVVHSFSCISTCFGRPYAHRQESRLRFTAYGFQHWLLLVVVFESRVQSCVHSGEDVARATSFPQCKQLTPYSPRLQTAIASAENHMQ
jgi:hypothetical protein